MGAHWELSGSSLGALWELFGSSSQLRVYTPPYRKQMVGPLLNDIYQSTYDEQMRSLLKESKVFGIALFGDGATIQKVPMMNFWI